MKTSHFNLFKNSEPIVEGYRIDAKSKQALWDLILIVFLKIETTTTEHQASYRSR